MKKNLIILKILSFSILKKKGAKIKELFLRTVKRTRFLEKTWSRENTEDVTMQPFPKTSKDLLILLKD